MRDVLQKKLMVGSFSRLVLGIVRTTNANWITEDDKTGLLACLAVHSHSRNPHRFLGWVS